VATSTSLNLRASLKTAVTRSGIDTSARAVSGLTPPAKALLVASAAHAQPNGVVLFVVPGDGELEEACADVSFFLAALEGLAPAAVERAVLPFPSHEVDPYRGLAPHIGVTSVRARALYAIAHGGARVVVASAAAVLPRITTPGRLVAASLVLKPGQDISPVDLAELLVDAGFSREDPADEHGEFAIRGGIADVFPAGDPHPVRLEFIGDTIETLRTYDPATQRSIAPIDQVAIIPLRDVLDGDRGATIFDYLAGASASRIIISERDEVDAHATKVLQQINQSYQDILANLVRGGALSAPTPDELLVDWDIVAARFAQATTLSILGIDEGGLEVRSQPAMELRGRVADWVAEIRRLRDDGETILFVAGTPGRAERTIELLKEYDVFAIPVERAEDARYAAVLVAVGALSRGFRLPDAGLQIYAEADVFEEERRASERRRSATKAFLSDLRDLKVGDFVVHVDNGIGMFVGLKQIGVGDSLQEFLELRYAGDDKLFVPVERLDLVQKYTGASKPPIDRLGGASWEKAKSKVKKAMRDMAEELLKLYAARKAVPGHAFAPDSHWQQEFEDAFEYDLTIDQTSAITDIKKDMEAPTPMDRLLCGDVGYGKTEVAMRAAFKAVMDGKQVAVLAPTTVLAFQHQKTLKERFAGFPVRIDMVSRFRSKAEQTETLTDLAAGKVDLIVGTHRLLSRDVEFRDLGLLVVDEEQRFGVAHKEKI
jgi:transcription-repair coupling factor (superfamily II helicase)